MVRVGQTQLIERDARFILRVVGQVFSQQLGLLAVVGTGVVEAAVDLVVALGGVRAGHCFVDQGVVHLLFPAVGLGAVALEGAAVFVAADEVASLPLVAEFEWGVAKEVGFAAEVLPVVGVEALGFVVLVGEGAPFGFEVKHEELFILGHLVDQRGLDVVLGVGERAVVFVLAAAVGEAAEFELVALLVVEVLYFVVGLRAPGVETVRDVSAQLRVEQPGAPLVQQPMVVKALLVVVKGVHLAWEHFEVLDVQMHALSKGQEFRLVQNSLPRGIKR